MADYTAIKYNVPFSKAGSLKLITTTTASSDATISFTSGIDSTYKEYLFIFNNIHGATDDKALTVGFRDGSTAYDATKTTTFFRAYNEENDSATAFAYGSGQDLAQATGFQNLGVDAGTDNDQSTSGYMYLFNPSSTTFVKHFIASAPFSNRDPAARSLFTAGYGNTTSAVDAIQFSMSSGNIDAGVIKFYGFK